MTADGFAKVGESTDLSTASTIEGAKKYADARISQVTAGELTAYYKKTETSSAAELTTEFGNYYKKTETSSATELDTKFGTTLTAVSGTGTGVVTGISKDGQTVSASFTNLAVTKTATAGSALAGVTQDANGQITAFTEISVLAASDVKIGYDSDAKKIVLSAAGLTSEVDATDFIKDGMLSTVAYDAASHNIVLTFNTDAGTTPISVDVGALVDTYTATSSDTVNMTVTNNEFRAEVRDDSLTMAKFSPTETFVFDCGGASL